MSRFAVNKFLQLRNHKEYIDVNVVDFKDGTKSVSIPDIVKYDRDIAFKIELYQRSMDDIMVVAQIVDIIRRNTRGAPHIELSLRSPMYMRYDRVMKDDKSDAFALAQFVKMVSTTGVNHVTLVDPHSEVAVELFRLHMNGHVGVITQDDCVWDTLKFTVEDFKTLGHYDIISPDAGAAKKLTAYHTFKCTKSRDPNNGGLSNFGISKEQLMVLKASKKDRIIIIDDICENGGTFIGCHKMLREHGITKPMDLYITHGMFPDIRAMGRLWGVFENIYMWNCKYSTYLNLKCHTQANIHPCNVFIENEKELLDKDK
ncbi:ribose-phosphate pyrophosphokinase [Acinetobacter phage vB_AbaM_P1]|nr:ribose-phosphate pyrophosphokinase [Acinetobacter phage vB_AbaM_P1]